MFTDFSDVIYIIEILNKIYNVVCDPQLINLEVKYIKRK